MTIYFFENLKYLRKLHDISQAELAQAIEKVSSTISNWETAKQNPDLMDLIKICNYFNIQIQDIVYTNLKELPTEQIKNLKYSNVRTVIHNNTNKDESGRRERRTLIDLLKTIVKNFDEIEK